MTLVTFFVCPFRMVTTCSVSLLKMVAFLSLPPVKILLVSELEISNAKIPGTLAECKLYKKNKQNHTPNQQSFQLILPDAKQ